MTTPTPSAQHTRSGAPFAAMLRAALLPSALAGILAVVGMVLARGGQALAGGVFGLAVALAFFGLGMLVLSRLVRDADLRLFVAIALTVYLGQIIGLLLVVLVVRDATWVDRPSMALVVAVVTITWQLFALRALRTVRMPVFDVPAPPKEARRGG